MTNSKWTIHSIAKLMQVALAELGRVKRADLEATLENIMQRPLKAGEFDRAITKLGRKVMRVRGQGGFLCIA